LHTLREVAHLIAQRLCALFLPDANGRRPSDGEEPRYQTDEHFKSLVTFYEFFHGDTGKGLGAAHQTGWTALVVEMLLDVIHARRPR